jgi:hypothetical protein
VAIFRSDLRQAQSIRIRLRDRLYSSEVPADSFNMSASILLFPVN